jgi:signal peptidase I
VKPERERVDAAPRAIPTFARLRPGALVGAVLLYALASAPTLLTRVLYLEAFETDGPSMEPTLLDGDRFVIDRSALGLFLPWEREARASWGLPEVGDVVVVRSPMDELDIVKRVIGLPGDRIAIREDEVFRNGISLGRGSGGEDAAASGAVEVEERVGERRWRTRRDPEWPASLEETIVPRGHVFVLGDHRSHSNDSRRIGPIPIGRLVGIVRLRYASPAGAPLGEIGAW